MTYGKQSDTIQDSQGQAISVVYADDGTATYITVDEHGNTIHTTEDEYGNLISLVQHKEYVPKNKLSRKKRKFIILGNLYPTKREWTSAKLRFAVRRFVCLIICLAIIFGALNFHVRMLRRWGIEIFAKPKKSKLHLHCAKIIANEVNGTYRFHIPYAKAPSGNDRFRKPRAPETFEECYEVFWKRMSRIKTKVNYGSMELEADEKKPFCLQADVNGIVEGDENCLYVSIVTPRLHTYLGFFPLSVVVYIGGHGYARHRPYLPADDVIKQWNVVYVAINYRLGALGFANFKTGDANGNYGIFDIQLALEWIRTYISRFGGSHERVTILGEYSGATTAMLLVNQQRKYRNFSAAWLRAGSYILPKFQEETSPTKNLLEWCSSENPNITNLDRLKCLRQNVSAHEIFYKTHSLWQSNEAYMSKLPSPVERKISFPNTDSKFDFLTSPIGLIQDMAKEHNISALPLAFVTGINDIPNHVFDRLTNIPQNLYQLSDAIRNAFSSLRIGHVIKSFDEDMINAVQNMLEEKRFIEKYEALGGTAYNDFGIKDIYVSMISALRTACPVNVVVKYLQVNGHVPRTSGIYRLEDLSVFYEGQSIDAENKVCDIPLFLVTPDHPCRSTIDDKNRMKLIKYQKQYQEYFFHFAKRSSTVLHKARYPLAKDDPEFEETFNIIGDEKRIESPNEKLTFQRTLCDIWTVRNNPFPTVSISGTVN